MCAVLGCEELSWKIVAETKQWISDVCFRFDVDSERPTVSVFNKFIILYINKIYLTRFLVNIFINF